MALGQLYNDFSDRSLNIEFIFNYYTSLVSRLYDNIIEKFDYNPINITGKIIDTVKSANDPIEFSNRLYKIVNNTAVGYSAKKINMIYMGENPDDLILIIPSHVFSDEFFPRFFSKVNYIHDNFPYDKYEFLTLLSLIYPLKGLKEKLFPSELINSNQVHNLFNKMFFPVEKNIRKDYQNKSSYLSLILVLFGSYYIRYSNNYSSIITTVTPDQFISKTSILNNLKLFINNNIESIADEFYRYIVNTIMCLYNETPSFKLNIKEGIVNDILDNDLNLNKVKFKDIDISVLLYLFKELSLYYSYLITENVMYKDTRYDSDIMNVDIIKLLDIERYILSRFHREFIYELSDYIRSIQYFSMRFKKEGLFFLNTISFLHHYFISNLIYDKKIPPLSCVFDVFYNESNLSNFILSSVSFKNVSIDNSIKNIMINGLTDKVIKTIMIDHLLEPIYQYVDSDDFISFIVDMVSGIYDNINEFYYYINTSFEFLERVRMFFKLMILRNYFSSNLFDQTVSSIKNLALSIIYRSSFRKDLSSMYREFSEYSWKTVYNAISSYSFSGVYVHYLYWTFLEPLLI